MVETGCDSRATFVTVTVTSDGYHVGQELLQAANEAKEPKLVVRNTFLDLEVPMPTWQAVGQKCAMQTHYDWYNICIILYRLVQLV